DGDQGRQHESLQRAGLCLRHDREDPQRLLQEGERRGRGERAQGQLQHAGRRVQPAKAVEMVRRLVEQDEVAFVFQTLGTPSNTAIWKYLNDEKVPQLFVATGA